MTDMFTILLVFLLQTYSVAEIQVTPDQGQALPLSSAENNPVLSVQISLTKDHLKIEDRIIANIKDLDFTSQDIDSNDPNFIKPLFTELEKLSKSEKQKDEAFKSGTSPVKANSGVLDGKILVKADQTFSYGVMRKVMYTASMAGFPKMKMATVVGN